MKGALCEGVSESWVVLDCSRTRLAEEKALGDWTWGGGRRAVAVAVADEARSSAGQRKAGMEASWFSSVRACLRVGRMLVFLVSWYLICANSKLDGKITHGVGVKQPMSGPVGASESEAVAPAPSHRSSPADVLRGESSVDCFPGVFCSDHPLRNYHSCRSVAELCFPLSPTLLGTN